VIRIVLLASLLALAAEARRPPLPPRPPEPPRAPAPPPPDAEDDCDADDADVDVDVDVPEVQVDVPGVPVRVPDVHVHLGEMLSRAFASSGRTPAPDDDEDSDQDEDQPEERDENGNKVRIYKLHTMKRDLRRMQQDIRKMARGRHDDDDWDMEGGAQAHGSGSTALSVNGPVTFRLNAQAGDVEIIATDQKKVSATLTDAPPEDISLRLFGDRVEVSFRGRSQMRRGKLHVELPRGSRVDLNSMSGDVTVQKLSGEVRIRTMSGDVKLFGVAKADVQTISGDARIDDASGPVRLHTVSGHAVISSSGATPQLEFQSASGDLDWSGLCARDCHVTAETVSGVVRLAVDPRSSFELSYTSHSGEMRDELNLAVKHSPKRKHGLMGGWLEATYGKGEGVIEADAFSGNLVVKKK
jgi:hypothetical protein